MVMGTNNGTGESLQTNVQDVAQELGDLGRELRQKANDIRGEVVNQLNAAADSIRSQARETSDNREAHQAADEIAKGLEKAAHYLNNHSVEQMGVQATRVVRQNSVRILFVVFVVGLLLGLIMRNNGKK
jgi:vacuolar-type H+-ATPase subunit I/STV1